MQSGNGTTQRAVRKTEADLRLQKCTLRRLQACLHLQQILEIEICHVSTVCQVLPASRDVGQNPFWLVGERPCNELAALYGCSVE